MKKQPDDLKRPHSPIPPAAAPYKLAARIRNPQNESLKQRIGFWSHRPEDMHRSVRRADRTQGPNKGGKCPAQVETGQKGPRAHQDAA